MFLCSNPQLHRPAIRGISLQPERQHDVTFQGVPTAQTISAEQHGEKSARLRHVG